MGQEYHDEHFKCSWKKDDGVCGAPFIWTVKDQEFYAERKFSKPKYCREHREERKKQQQGAFGPALREVRSTSYDHKPKRRKEESFGEY